jgi:hypothetical protein
VLLGIALGVSAAYSILKAKDSLDQAHQIVSEITDNPNQLLTPEDRSKTMQRIAQLDADVAAAQHTLDVSPGVWAMWALPYLHTQRQVVMDLLTDLRTAAGNGQTLLTTVNRLSSASHGTTISLPELRQLHAQLVTARDQMAPLSEQSGGLLPLLPPLAHALSEFDRQDAHLTGLLSDGSQLSDYALTFLGANGPRTYLLAAQNNAEMRDQGAILSYALVTTDNGTFQVGSASSVGNLTLSSPAPVPMSPGMRAVFGDWEPTQVWQSTNATADFPWTGRDVTAMYAQATGQHVHGVLALDVPGLARLLELVGPVTVPGIGEPVTSSNLATIVLHDLYQGLPPQSSQVERQDLLSSVAKAVFDQMQQSHVDVAALANALAKDAAGRHLLAWDSVPSNESTIAKFGASGAVDNNDPGRTFHVAVENGGASKMDYYTTVSVSEAVTLTPAGGAQIQTTITTKNTAPANQAPSYQLGPDGINTTVPGEYDGRIFLWGPRRSIQYGSVRESGLSLLQSSEDVMPQQSETVEFFTQIPDAVQGGQLHLVFVPQPRLTPDQLSVKVSGSGWTISGPPSTQTTWDKTLDYTWNAHR